MLEYKHFTIGFHPSSGQWVAWHDDNPCRMYDYPDLPWTGTPAPLRGASIEEVYGQLLLFYQKNETIRTWTDFHEWLASYRGDLRKKCREELEDDMKNHDGIPWNVRILKGHKEKREQDESPPNEGGEL